MKADTAEALTSDFAALTRPLHLPEQNEQKQNRALEAVKRWLKTHPNWLLILDNVEDIAMVRDVLSLETGYILLTTRTQVTGPFARCIDLEQMQPEEGALFLLRRAKLIEPEAPLEDACEGDQDRAKETSQLLDGLPLALDQAGAYIEEAACSLSDYVGRYQRQRSTLLNRRGRLVADHPESVSTTLALSFENVEQINPAAADLLRLCAFLDPDAILEELITQGAAELGPLLEPITTDQLAFDEALAALRTCSLIHRHPEAKTLTMHRLVQAVLKESMDEDTRRQWAERAVRVVNRAFPNLSELSTWPACRRCLPHAQRCAELIEHWQMSFPAAVQLLPQTGAYLKERARYVQAERFLSKARDLHMQALGPMHPAVAESLHELADLSQYRGNYAQAESLYRQALAIREQTLGQEHPDVATSLHRLAVFYYYHGPFAQAEPLYQRALAIREQALGQEHPAVALLLSDLALLYHDQGKDAQAESLYQHALTLFEKTVGTRPPLVAMCLNNLAKLYNDQGRHLQAEPLHQRALAIFEEMLGPEHPIVAFSLHDLAKINQARGQYAQAERLHRRALAVREQAVGPEHSDVANSLNSLGQCYFEQGQHERAEPLFERALAIFEKARGPQHIYTGRSLHNLAKLYVAQACSEEAEPLVERALAILEKRRGPQHPEVATLLENYAALLATTKREAEAAKLIQRAAEIRAKHIQQNTSS